MFGNVAGHEKFTGNALDKFNFACTIAQHSTEQHSTAQHSTAQH